MKETLLFIIIIIILYKMDVRVVVEIIDTTTIYWNAATIYITTFRDRHPFIMMFMPVLIIMLVATFRGDPDARV